MKFLMLLIVIAFCTACQSVPVFQNNDDQIEQNQKEIQTLKQELEETRKQLIQRVSQTIRSEILPELREVQLGNNRVLSKAQLKLQKNMKKKIVIGRVEWVHLIAPDINVRARIDTGAQTCSLHAEKVSEKEVDGELYVEFTTLDEKNKPHRMMKKVVEMKNVKSTTGKSEKRYVVEMDLALGKRKVTVGVNLNNRKKLRHRFLVGRNLLLGDYIVDVSQSRILGDGP